jgi:hypothetical protein
MKISHVDLCLLLLGGASVLPSLSLGDSYVQLTEVPDYTQFAGCSGTASGNLMGFWDRHGFPDFYTGPTGGGVAPLDTWTEAKKGIRSMWASRAGMDGRPANKPGHIDDYWVNYASDETYSFRSTAPDPYVTAERPEHPPDSISDFTGLSQRKWRDLAGECDGNIDAFAFVFWDKTGERRYNYSFTNTTGEYIPDIQAGLKAWTRYRGHDADVFTQLTSFNRERTGTGGFTYADVKAEIDAGYPFLCSLQPTDEFWRYLAEPVPMERANPRLHTVLVYGYIDVPELGASQSVLIRTSWGLGSQSIQPWAQADWVELFPVRGVIGYRPRPKIKSLTRADGNLTLTWDGPSAQIQDMLSGAPPRLVHGYQVEQSSDLIEFRPVGETTTDRTLTLPNCCEGTTFFRIKVVPQ